MFELRHQTSTDGNTMTKMYSRGLFYDVITLVDFITMQQDMPHSLDLQELVRVGTREQSIDHIRQLGALSSHPKQRGNK